jgi:pSer/pThr/pTyr-binding forkhead associated (FHA) protein
MPEYQLVVTVPPGQRRAYSLTHAMLTIGRSEDNDVVIGEQGVSRHHARLRHVRSGFEIQDLGSTNGTWLKGKAIKRAPLPVGSILTIANTTLRLRESSFTLPDEPMPRTVGELTAVMAGSALDVELPDLAHPRLVINAPTHTWELTLAAEVTTIGRHPDSEVMLPDDSVAPWHARIIREKDAFILEDLGSPRGTWVGGHRINKHELKAGDSFRIGSYTLVYNAASVEDGNGDAVKQARTRKGRVRSPVVFLPGFMGSELWRGNERIWPNVAAMFTNPEIYRVSSNTSIEARQLVSEIVVLPKFIKLERYAALGDFLCKDLDYERGKDLLEFPWDWRLDLRLSARRLAERIELWRDKVKEAREPITLIAHSMGCLVARYYVEKLNGKSQVSRMMMIGGTHSGMPKTLQPFGAYGKQPFFYGLAEPFERAIASLPSLYTMLPTYSSIFDSSGKPIDLYRDESWCPEEYRANLRDALAFRGELGTNSSVSTICIFGYGIQTPTRAILENRDPNGTWERLRLVAESKGDNTVPEESARLSNAEIHPVHQHHGTLYADKDVKMRLKLELT